jgi:hypothetical protein
MKEGFKDVPLKRMLAYHLFQSLNVGLGTLLKGLVPFRTGRGLHLSGRKDNNLVSSSVNPKGKKNEERGSSDQGQKIRS